MISEREDREEDNNLIELVNVPKRSTEKRLTLVEAAKQNKSGKQSKRLRQMKTLGLESKVDKHLTFEDSRQTKVIFAKYKIIELARLAHIIVCTILSVFQYEQQFYGKNKEQNILLLYLIFGLTILIEFYTVISYKMYLNYKKLACTVPSYATLKSAELLCPMLLEMILLAVHPSPFLYGRYHIKVYTTLNITFEDKFYYINEILTYIMLYRCILAFKLALKFSDFYNPSVGRLCRMYSVDLNTQLIFKCMMQNYSYQIQCIIYLIGTLLFSFGVRISERIIIRNLDGSVEDYDVYEGYGMYFWMTTITIPSVGYGDFYPYSDMGRFSMTLCVLWGVTMTSLFIASLITNFYPSNGEILSWALIDRSDLSSQIKEESIQMINKTAYLYVQKKKNQLVLNDKTENQLFSIRKHYRSLAALKRSYRSIDGEDIVEMMGRNFQMMRSQIMEYRNNLKIMKYSQELQKMSFQANSDSLEPYQFQQRRDSKLDKQNSTQEKQARNLNTEFKFIPTVQSFIPQVSYQSQQTQNPQRKYQDKYESQTSERQRSKDDKFFEDLVETKKDLKLMVFEESNFEEEDDN